MNDKFQLTVGYLFENNSWKWVVIHDYNQPGKTEEIGA